MRPGNDGQWKPGPPETGRAAEHSGEPESVDEEAPPYERLQKRIADGFPANYLTIIAIIEGVALGVALTAAYQNLQAPGSDLDRATVVAQVLAVLTGIISTTLLYILLTILYRWPPTIFDTLIPYGLGVGSIAAGLTIGHDAAWTASACFYGVMAVLAFLHTGLRSGPSGIDGVVTRQSYRRTIVIQSLICSIVLVPAIALTFLEAGDIGPQWISLVPPCIFGISGVSVTWVGQREANRIYKSYG
jgi:hypothetical protein